MDQDKLRVLKEIHYEIKEVCGNCVHSKLSADGWGTCTLQRYVHQKHSESERELSINRAGYCDQHLWRSRELLGAYDQFVLGG
jgi:hypothetical protein